MTGSAPMPDACNAGVALRAFVAANAVTLVLALTAGGTPATWWPPLLHGLAAAEPATALWLGLMCAGRPLWRPRPRLHAPLGVAAGAAVAWGVPALMALAGGDGAARADWRAAVLGGALAALFLRDQSLRGRALTPATVQARLDELQARIRPHFLFNALNAASALVHEQPARAEVVLDDLAELFRATVSRTGTLSPVRDEVELARRYLDIEEVRFGPRMRVDWQLDPGADALRIPALTLQPLVENAVRHGVESSTGPCHIVVAVRLTPDALDIEVSNDYQPRTGDGRGTGTALGNITQRLRLLYDITADLRHGPVDGSDPPRYAVRVRLPR